MNTLATTHAASTDVALHSVFSRFVAEAKDTISAFHRAIEFSRRCEAEFSSTGQVSPETLDLLSKRV